MPIHTKLIPRWFFLITIASIAFTPIAFSQNQALITPTFDQNLLNQYISATGGTVDANPVLKCCIQGTSAVGCSSNSCNTKVQALRIFQGAKELTGYYTISGEKCKANNQCAFSVNAWFQADCGKSPAGAILNTCEKAVSFTSNYFINNFRVSSGLTPLAATSTENNPNRPSVIMKMQAIQPILANDFTCPSKNGKPQIVIGQDAQGYPICGPDPNQVAIDELTKELCKSRLAQIWQTGGSLTAPCENINVTKAFYLKNGSNWYQNSAGQYKTTSDCLSNLTKAKLIYPNNIDITQLYSTYPGGVVTKNGARLTPNEVVQFASQNGLTLTSQSQNIYCYKYQPVWSNPPIVNSSFTLPSDYAYGSLVVFLVGGGGGGGGAGGGVGGYGGGSSGSSIQYFSTGVWPSQNCQVTVGGRGLGASKGCNTGGWGGESSVTCGYTTKRQSGGNPGSCGGGCGGSTGANFTGTAADGTSITGTGGAGESKDAGGAASGYAAGGGGGGTCGATGDHSGGDGSSGYVQARWKIDAWTPVTNEL